MFFVPKCFLHGSFGLFLELTSAKMYHHILSHSNNGASVTREAFHHVPVRKRSQPEDVQLKPICMIRLPIMWERFTLMSALRSYLYQTEKNKRCIKDRQVDIKTKDSGIMSGET